MQMSFEQASAATPARILCCMCGTPIAPNASNMCVNCIRGQVDITDGIPKQLTIFHCGHCGRYLQPPETWLYAELESRELLTFCLKRLKGLNKVKLVDAAFIYTEPHSRRLKVKVTVQQEVFTSTILQQVFVVEYTVNNQQCKNCAATFTEHTWTAVVQVRQKAEHKRTFLFLEQQILKHQAHLHTIKVQEQPEGIDFFFGNRSHASKFVDFLQAISPIRYKTSEKLISSDTKSNIHKFNYTFSAEIAPVSRDDLVCLPRNVSQAMGGVCPFLICTKVSNVLHLLDPNTLQGGDMNASVYWQHPFRPIAGQRQLVEFIVLDINLLGPTRGKFALADAQIARSRDLGFNDITFYVRTHLGHILKPGDTCLGYDIKSGNFNDADVVSMQGKEMPDVILVRKSYPVRRRRNRARPWKLRHIEKEEAPNMRKTDYQKAEKDMEQFLQDLEEDPEYRAGINLYKNAEAPAAKPAASMADTDGEDEEEDFPEPALNELIDDLEDMSLHE